MLDIQEFENETGFSLIESRGTVRSNVPLVDKVRIKFRSPTTYEKRTILDISFGSLVFNKLDIKENDDLILGYDEENRKLFIAKNTGQVIRSWKVRNKTPEVTNKLNMRMGLNIAWNTSIPKGIKMDMYQFVLYDIATVKGITGFIITLPPLK